MAAAETIHLCFDGKNVPQWADLQRRIIIMVVIGVVVMTDRARTAVRNRIFIVLDWLDGDDDNASDLVSSWFG